MYVSCPNRPASNLNAKATKGLESFLAGFRITFSLSLLAFSLRATFSTSPANKII